MTFLRRKIVRPLVTQLKQGQTPEKLALSVAFGVVLSCCPLLGATTTLCLVAGVVFGLNHPALQAANYLGYPLQLALMIPFFRAGEGLFGAPRASLSLDEILRLFRADCGLALRTYGLLALRGSVVWLCAAPPTVFALSKALRPAMARLARGLAAPVVKEK